MGLLSPSTKAVLRCEVLVGWRVVSRRNYKRGYGVLSYCFIVDLACDYEDDFWSRKLCREAEASYDGCCLEASGMMNSAFDNGINFIP